MARLRFSLAGLAGIVALAALSCAALVNASTWIASASLTIIFLLLCFATIRGVLRPGGFWAGFAIAAWLYVAVALGPFTGQFGRSLATTLVLYKLAHAMPQPGTNVAVLEYRTVINTTPTPLPNLSAGPPTPVYSAPPTPYYQPVRVTVPTMPSASAAFVESFVQIGQALWTMLLGIAGGIIGILLGGRKKACFVDMPSNS